MVKGLWKACKSVISLFPTYIPYFDYLNLHFWYIKVWTVKGDSGSVPQSPGFPIKGLHTGNTGIVFPEHTPNCKLSVASHTVWMDALIITHRRKGSLCWAQGPQLLAPPFATSPPSLSVPFSSNLYQMLEYVDCSLLSGCFLSFCCKHQKYFCWLCSVIMNKLHPPSVKPRFTEKCHHFLSDISQLRVKQQNDYHLYF